MKKRILSISYLAVACLVSSLILLAAGPSCAAGSGTTPKNIIFKAIDEDSSRPVYGAAVGINGKMILVTSAAGYFTVDLNSPALKGEKELRAVVSRDGYVDGSISVSLEKPDKIMQPVRIRMKQKMSVIEGKIVGCWLDSEGHHNDRYSNEEIKVVGQAVSMQTVMQKFEADRQGNFVILNLPVGTYEIEIRHKKWTVPVEKPDQILVGYFAVRSCNRQEYHSGGKVPMSLDFKLDPKEKPAAGPKEKKKDK